MAPIENAVNIAINPNKVSLVIPKVGAQVPDEEASAATEKQVNVVD